MKNIKLTLAFLVTIPTYGFSFSNDMIDLMDKALERKNAVTAIIGRAPNQRELDFANALPADIPLNRQNYFFSLALEEAHLVINSENIATAAVLEEHHCPVNSDNINAVRSLSLNNLEINSINIEAAAALPDGTLPTAINIPIAYSLLHPHGGGAPLEVDPVNIETSLFLQGLGVDINTNTLAAARAFNMTCLD